VCRSYHGLRCRAYTGRLKQAESAVTKGIERSEATDHQTLRLRVKIDLAQVASFIVTLQDMRIRDLRVTRQYRPLETRPHYEVCDGRE
jgi:hypothetical protein